MCSYWLKYDPQSVKNVDLFKILTTGWNNPEDVGEPQRESK